MSILLCTSPKGSVTWVHQWSFSFLSRFFHSTIKQVPAFSVECLLERLHVHIHCTSNAMIVFSLLLRTFSGFVWVESHNQMPFDHIGVDRQTGDPRSYTRDSPEEFEHLAGAGLSHRAPRSRRRSSRPSPHPLPSSGSSEPSAGAGGSALPARISPPRHPSLSSWWRCGCSFHCSIWPCRHRPAGSHGRLR